MLDVSIKIHRQYWFLKKAIFEKILLYEYVKMRFKKTLKNFLSTGIFHDYNSEIEAFIQ